MKFSSLLCVLVLTRLVALRGQTWVGGNTGNFNVGANWSGGTVPTSGADLTFTNVTNGATNVAFNSLPFSANSLTFTSTANLYTFGGNNGILTLGAGGVTTNAGGGGVSFNPGGANIALGANQTWTIGPDVTVNSNVSGGFALTKAGAGYLTLSGTNSYTGGTTIDAGTLYLGPTNSSSGTISVQSGGVLGATFGQVTLGNAVSLANGATFGGSLFWDRSEIELTGTVTLGTTTPTVNLHNSQVNLSNTLAGPAAGTALMVHSDATGLAVIAGGISNIASITADNAAIGFGTSSSLPATVHAINGGYVSVGDIGGATPTVASLLGAVADKSNFNGTIGFDTSDQISTAHNYTAAVDLTGFTSGNVRLGSLTRAILSGTITPAGQSYDFAGYGGAGGGLFIQSNLADHGGPTSVNITSPNAQSATRGGLAVVFQGANTFTGNLSVNNSIAILDSAAALPSKNFSLGANSYVGITENTSYTNFADFAGHLQSGYTTTSILGLDSATLVADFAAGTSVGSVRTITDTIDLTNRDLTLGTVAGVTIGSGSTLTAPSGGVLRLVNLGDGSANFTIDAALTTGNGVASVVAGMPGSEGNVVLSAANNYTGGTTLQGGNLLVGNSGSLGSGNIAVLTSSESDIGLGAASGSISLSNNISVTDRLTIGTGKIDDNNSLTVGTTTLTLNGVISDIDGSHHGQLSLTGPTTLSGTNTYSGGTHVLANTTVSANSGLGTGFVDIGYNAVLTLSSANPSIGSLANASQFLNFNAGTGNISLNGVTSLTINQTTGGVFSGAFSGSTGASLIKNGGAQLTLLGSNTGKFTGGVTINAGNLSIGNAAATTATFNSNVALNVSNSFNGLFLRPGAGQTMTYNGSITTTSGSGSVTINGSNTGVVDITGGSSAFTGATNVSAGTLKISADNAWSSASTINLSSTATIALQVNANQTLLNLGGAGKIDIASTKALTTNTTTATTLSGVISGAGALVKSGTSTLTLSGTNTYSGGTTLSAGTLIVSNNSGLGNVAGGVTFNGGTLQTNGAITANRAATFTGAGTINTNGQNSTWSGALSGSGAFTKTGSGNLFLTGASPSFTGATNVTGGSLIVNASLANSSLVTVSTGGSLYGNGTIGAATVAVGSSIGAGSSVSGPGTLSASSIAFTGAGAAYNFLLSNATGGAGTGWGLMAVSGAWDFNNAPFTISLSTVNGGVSAPATNFDPNAATQFLAATVAGGITGFVPGNVTFNTSNFSNSFPGSFSASVTGNNLYLNYSPTAIPEPATTAALAGLAALGLVAWRRQRNARMRSDGSK